MVFQNPVSPNAMNDDLLARFPGFAGLLAIPDLASVLEDAAKNLKTPAQLQAAIQGTPWWKNTPEPARKWQVLYATDPAQAKIVLDTQIETIRQAASQLGVTNLDLGDVWGFADQALREGWSADQIKSRLVDRWVPGDTGQMAGQAAATRDEMRAAAKAYFVPLSDQGLGRWTQDVLAGRATAEGYTSWLAEQAKSLYPHLSQALDSGQTLAQYADPYAQLAAQRLEINPDDIDFTDPKWNRALASIDPKDNSRRPLSLSEWDRVLRTDEQFGYDKTNQARENAYELAGGLKRMFGFEG